MNHRTVKPHRCTLCPASYSQKSRLEIHIRKHQGVKPFQCDLCRKLFTEKGNLNVHMKSHVGALIGSGASSGTQETCMRAKTIGAQKKHKRIQSPDEDMKPEVSQTEQSTSANHPPIKPPIIEPLVRINHIERAPSCAAGW